MFKNIHQGGAFIEIFTANAAESVATWKLTHPSIKQKYDRSVKGYILGLEGSPITNHIQLPKERKDSLGLNQSYLVLQVYIPEKVDWTLQLGISDHSLCKRRLHFSTLFKSQHVTPLHCKLPLGCVQRNTWQNLLIDLSSLVCGLWPGHSYRSLESITITACCRLRRVFTMADLSLPSADRGVVIPRSCQFAPGVDFIDQTMDWNTLNPATKEPSGTLNPVALKQSILSKPRTNQPTGVSAGIVKTSSKQTSRRPPRPGDQTRQEGPGSDQGSLSEGSSPLSCSLTEIPTHNTPRDCHQFLYPVITQDQWRNAGEPRSEDCSSETSSSSSLTAPDPVYRNSTPASSRSDSSLNITTSKHPIIDHHSLVDIEDPLHGLGPCVSNDPLHGTALGTSRQSLIDPTTYNDILQVLLEMEGGPDLTALLSDRGSNPESPRDLTTLLAVRGLNAEPKSPGGDSATNDDELDLLYDPCFNCFYDSITHKYYRLIK